MRPPSPPPGRKRLQMPHPVDRGPQLPSRGGHHQAGPFLWRPLLRAPSLAFQGLCHAVIIHREQCVRQCERTIAVWGLFADSVGTSDGWAPPRIIAASHVAPPRAAAGSAKEKQTGRLFSRLETISSNADGKRPCGRFACGAGCGHTF